MLLPLVALSTIITQALATISDAQYSQLFEGASWAKVAYCTADLTFDEGNLANECPLMDFCTEHNTVQLIDVIRPNIAELEISGSAYVAADDTNKKVYAVFRGSLSPGDWITDITFAQCDYVPYIGSTLTAEKLVRANGSDVDTLNAVINDNGDSDACVDCKVHCGLFIAYTQFMERVYTAAKPYIEMGYNLTVSGHSLGGGYAALAGLDFQLAGANPLVITYASLRSGNPEFNKFVDEKFGTADKDAAVAAGNALEYGTYARVYDRSDIVPELPPGDYTHSGLQFELTTSMLTQTADEVVYNGPSNNDENSAFDFDWSNPLNYFIVLQHLNYFVRVSWPCTDAFNIKE